MPNDPINQSADLLLQTKQKEIASKQNTEIEEVIDTIDNDLGFFANSLLRLAVSKTKLQEILSTQEINSKEDFLNAAFNKNAKLLGSEKLGSVANRIGKKTLEFSNYFSDVFKLLQAKNKEILAIVDKYKIELDNLKSEIINNSDNENNDNENNDNENNDNENNDNESNDNENNDNENNDNENNDNENNDNENNDNENNDNEKPSVLGTTVMAYGTVFATSRVAGFGINKIDKMKINKKLFKLDMLDINKQTKAIDNIITELQTRKKWKGFETAEGAKAKKNIDKSIKHFEQMKKDLRISRRSLASWKELEKAGLLDAKAFSHFVSNPQLLKNIEKITKSGKLNELKKILSTNPTQAKQLLGIADNVKLPRGVIKSIKNIKDIKDIKKISKVIKNAKVISRSAKAISSIPFLDLAFFGVDIRAWSGASDEAEIVKKYNKLRGKTLQNQANSHLITGGVSAIVDLTLAGLALAGAGPAGRVAAAIAVVVGATVAAVDYGLDSMYYDVVAFYQQNTEDYLNKYRIQTKQSIVSIMQSLNPNVENAINEEWFVDMTDEQKIKTMTEAYQALILNEEGLSLNDKNNNIVELRMKYITQNMQNKKMIAMCAKGDMNAPALLLSQSKSYEHILQDKDYLSSNPSPEANLQSLINYKAWLTQNAKQKNKDSYDTLMNMDDSEFYRTYNIVHSNALSDYDNNDKVINNKKLIEDIYFIRTFNKPKEMLAKYNNINSYGSLIAANEFLKQTTIEKGIGFAVQYSKEEVYKDFTTGNIDYYDSVDLSDISNSISQNILYRIAKEIHGYTGPNTNEELLKYFSNENADDSLGLYYNGKWIINNDWAVDKSFDPAIFEKDTLNTDDIIKLLMKSHWSSSSANVTDAIDTVTETADDSLNKDFWGKIKHIIEDEREYMNKSKIQEIKNKTTDFIKTNAKNGYISLPYYLQVQTMKAGLGNCSKSFFKYENDKIVELSPQKPYSKFLNMLHIKKPFVDEKETINRPFDKMDKEKQKKFDVEIKKFTDYVNKPLDRLKAILKDNGLDIPTDYKSIIDEKIMERDSLIFSLKNYTPDQAKLKIEKNYDSYAKWFDNLYTSLLSGVYSNILVADQDSAEQMNMHLSIAKSKIITINPDNGDLQIYFQGNTYGNKKSDKNSKIESYSSNKLTKMFFTVYSKVSIPYKNTKTTCENIAKEDVVVAEHYAKIIRRSILELETIDFDIDKDGNLKFQSFNSNIEKSFEKHWDKVLIVATTFTFPATLFSIYKSSKEKKLKQALFTKIFAYNFKNNPYKTVEFSKIT